MDTLQSFETQHREQQQKYIYYLIALSVAAIAFSIHNTIDKPLVLSQIPLGIAVLLWGISIYSGLLFLQLSIGALVTNRDLLIAKQGSDPKSRSKLVKEINNVSIKTVRLANLQLRTFYGGMVFYVLWHVIEMLLITI